MIFHRLACCITFSVSGVKYPDINSIGEGVLLLTVLEYRISQKESGDNKSLLVILHPQPGHGDEGMCSILSLLYSILDLSY